MTEPKRLMRDVQHGLLGGVATGMARYFDVDPVLMRVIFVLVLIFTAVFPAALAYVILWVLIPPMPATPPVQAAPPPQAPQGP